MMLKAFLIWLLIIPIAILNGGLREICLQPLLGEVYANLLSGFILCVAIFLIAYFSLPKLNQSSLRSYVLIGLLWVALTLTFETLFGLVQGHNFEKILQNYNMTRGNLWPLIVIFIGIVPWCIAKLREPHQN